MSQSSVTQARILDASEPPLRVMALHALNYCERLFYLEEVEEIRVADAAVYAGRRLHDSVVPLEDETPERRSFEVTSENWGLLGKVDALRKRDGNWIAYEHKKGRCWRDENKQPGAWPSDRLQAIAYAVLAEEELGQPVPESRIRYHTDNVTVKLTIDEAAREELRQSIERARELRRTTQRPPVHENERVCQRCSLKVVCLPEEERLSGKSKKPAAKLFPSHREGQTLHIVSDRAYVSRKAKTLVVKVEDEKTNVPIQQIDAVVVQGHGQMTTQALHLCAWEGIPVQWLSSGGRFLTSTTSPGRVQQRIRQFQALTDQESCLRLSRQLVLAKVEGQLKYLLRCTRSDAGQRSECAPSIDRIRECAKSVANADSLDSLRGLEGMAAKTYFSCWPNLLGDQIPQELRWSGRNKHPPRDRLNCLLSYGYSLVFALVHRMLLSVGLEPAFGFFHQPRTAAPPLVLDVMELFRTTLWEVPLVGSLNRNQWDTSADFEIRPGQVWLSDVGKRKTIGLFESRLGETWKHPHTGQSLSWVRIVELECRLLEKEWTGCPDSFAQLRIR
jgi:CRISP-associated protein Cas1